VFDSSNVQQIQLDGTSGLRFTQGASAINKVEWMNAAASVGQVWAAGNSTNAFLSLIAQDTSAGPVGQLSIQTTHLSNNANTNILAVADAQARTIIDGAASSSFMQLPSAQNKVAMSGFGSFTGNGTTSVTVANWPHGLGVSPNCLIMTAFGWVGYCYNGNTTRSSTTFNSITFASTFGNFTSGTTYFFSYYVST
jgi:hypothetical protein